MRLPLLQLLRPRDWVKNAFVLAPTIFSGSFLNYDSLFHGASAFALFCLASSAVYVFNDLVDVTDDRAHIEKRFTRPLAADAVTTNEARALLGLLSGVLLVCVLAWPPVMLAVLAYILVNVVYSLSLKHVPVVDLFCIATGFVLRVYVGALAIAVPLSAWMLITTLSLALYLAALKRRQELAASGSSSRAVLKSYSVALMNQYVQMAGASTILFYSFFVIEVRPRLVVTVPLVLFGLFRYLYLTESLRQGESPTDVVWRDVPLGVTVILWAAVSVYTLWPS